MSIRRPGCLIFLSPDAVTPHLEALFRGLLSMGNIFRVKIRGRDGAILWSDQGELIGQKFPDNDGFLEAMTGAVGSENAPLEKAENIDERDRGATLEIYTSVFRGKDVVGVVEMYEADHDLFVQIERNTLFTWDLVVVAGASRAPPVHHFPARIQDPGTNEQ